MTDAFAIFRDIVENGLASAGAYSVLLHKYVAFQGATDGVRQTFSKERNAA